MKTTALMDLMFVGLVVLLFAVFNNDAVFTLAESKSAECCNGDIRPKYKQYFSISILVENVPQNRTKLQRLMIYHFLLMTSGVYTIQTHKELKSAICTFIKATPITRRYFTERQRHTYDDIYADGIMTDKTYIGDIYVARCKDDPTKLAIEMRISLESNYEYRVRAPKTERNTLQNDCDPAWYEANKNRDLVKYYMGLRNKQATLPDPSARLTPTP